VVSEPASANGSYYFASPVRRLRPFATGGYTMFFRTNDYLSLWNVGGGEHFVNARFGLVIR
jgi:hypothetical protein